MKTQKQQKITITKDKDGLRPAHQPPNLHVAIHNSKKKEIQPFL